MSILGKRVKIINRKHPHYGEYGIADRMENTLVGPGLVINLENCPHGTVGCFVFKPEEVREAPAHEK